jgi:hypothetical protein|tara:strand:- start:619 stop:1032 length:414 start_codon:yes stop_codon:yes gene_type:complete
MGILGYAFKAGKKALKSKAKGDGKRITSIPIAKNLKKRRETTDSLLKIRQQYGLKPYTGNTVAKSVKSMSKSSNDIEKSEKLRKARNKKIDRNAAIAAGTFAAAGAGATIGANELAKKKFPKYKKRSQKFKLFKKEK